MRQSLERFMAAASHELKTPVAAIHNYLQLVTRRLEAGKPTEAGTYATRALLQADRLGQLVERLFDVSRIQSGQLELLMEPVDLVAVAREAVEAARVLTGAPPIQFSPANRSIRLTGDPGRLGQVMLNLLTNAIEHAPRTATIDVAVRKVGRIAEVEVRDHGDGIPADSLSGLFQAYARIGQGRRSGLGLGLFVAREIVTAHGGSIDVASVPGTGTTITVRLPVSAGGSRRGTKPTLSSK
jgi:two-component system OmpR family sensor kinase